MNLINKQVTHKSFGNGSIVEFEEPYLIINFETGNKSFVYPDAFESYLTILDEDTFESIEKILEIQRAERKVEEQILEEKRELELQERQIEKMVKNHKIHESSQVAFNCKEEELSEVFEEWKVFAGALKSGKNAGEPNKLIRVHQNSACIVTSKVQGMSEEDRSILGIYMVDESFAGRLCEDGYIPAHSQYRIKLTDEEAKQMPFWKYYINSRYPNNITWNSGKYRYFDNIWMAQILRDLVALKTDKEEQELVQQFYDHFCLKNSIDPKILPKPMGALTNK